MTNLKKLLVISDGERVSSLIREYLKEVYEVVLSGDFDLSRFVDERLNFDNILIDFLLLSDFKNNCNIEHYKNKLLALKESYPESRIIVLCDARKIEQAGELLNIGYHNILQVPFSKEVLEHRLQVEQEREKLQEFKIETSQAVVSPKDQFGTKNENFAELIEQLNRIAPTRSTILITGESGTGKSLLAKYIHRKSGREKQAFVDVHCGAIPESLVESELFGHEKGSFTGAVDRKIGKFELADKGSIFLDEIGTIGPTIQVKLLQVLQERFIHRVGGVADIPLDLRIIAATNSNIKEMVSGGSFREDLFYRLNVFQIEIPPLRKRKEDLPGLCSNLLEKFNRLYGKNIQSISSEVFDIFFGYDWPGNVRELENVLERAYVLESESSICVKNISKELISANREIINISPLIRRGVGLIEARKEATEAFEKKYITDLLIAHQGRVSDMARVADVSVRQIHKLLAKHGVRAKDFSIRLKGLDLEIGSM